MGRIPQIVTGVAGALQRVFLVVADEAAEQSGWCQRHRKLTGSSWVQAVTFAWLANARTTRAGLAQAAGCAGTPVSPQALAKRFDQKGAETLLLVLKAAVQEVLRSAPSTIELLRRFTGVYIEDSTLIALPSALATTWSGCGKGIAAVKAEFRFDLCRGEMDGPLLVPGRMHDARAARQHSPLTPGSLLLSDLGYFVLEVFQEMTRRGVYYLSRPKANTLFYLPSEGTQESTAEDDDCRQGHLVSFWLRKKLRRLAAKKGKRAAVDEVEMHLRMGAERLPCRVFARRVPKDVAQNRIGKLRSRARRKQRPLSQERCELADWTVLVTNVPPDLLNLREAMVLYRSRWQIERLFRLWKEVAEVDQWRSKQPWAILCEVYAKLLGCVVQHWLMLTEVWEQSDRSWHKSAQLIRHYAYILIGDLENDRYLLRSLQKLRGGMQCACQLEKRKKSPATFQLLQNPDLIALS